MSKNSNGELRPSQLSPIPGGRLSHGAAVAWLDMRAYILAQGGPAIGGDNLGPDSTYRSYGRQIYWRNYWCKKGKCGNAALPGTSNHGWGNAVDEPNADAQNWIRKVGHLFGWSHAEGGGIGEPWHFTYIGGYKRRKNPLEYLTKSERELVDEYRFLLRRRKKRIRRRILRKEIGAKRKGVWRAAQQSGWRKNNRAIRYRILRRYSV